MDRPIIMARKFNINRLLTVIIEHSTAIPFRWSSNKYMCFYCVCTFVDSSRLKQHNEEEHKEVNLKNLLRNFKQRRFKIDISDLACKDCLKPLSNLNDFLKHVSDFHDVEINWTATDCLFPFKLSDDHMHCLNCGQSFTFFGNLLLHCYQNHDKTSTFLCETCGKNFASRLSLESHVKTVHSKVQWTKSLKDSKQSDSKNLQCPKCAEIFRSRYLRNQHLTIVHDSAQFACGICSKTFIEKCGLIQHVSRVHIKVKSLTCEVCDFKALDSQMLKRHMVKHDDSRPYKCVVCEKTFRRKKNLNSHTRIHTNDRRFACKECGKAFVQGSSLKWHMRVHSCDGTL